MSQTKLATASKNKRATTQKAKRASRPVKQNKKKEKKTSFLTIRPGKIDLVFLFLLLVLLIIGLMCLYSSSYVYALKHTGDSYYFINRQLIFAVSGLGLVIVFCYIPFTLYQKLVIPLYLVTVALLIFALTFDPVQGVRRWIYIGNQSFQPSEIAKFVMIVMLASQICKYKEWITKIKPLLVMFVMPAMILVGFVYAGKHLSATILLLALMMVMLYLGGLEYRWIFLLVVLAIGAIFLVVQSGGVGYWGDRIEVWRDPWIDADDQGYQSIQSLYAIGSGGIWGVGFGKSQLKHLFLPEPQNDFIFAIVCEELGAVGAGFIIVLFALLVWRGFLIGQKCRNRFGSLVAMGISVQVGLQVVLNILVVTNTIPNTGISLPFFSYGGTSLWMLLAQMGIVLNISRFARTPQEQEEEDQRILEEEMLEE